MFVIGGRETFIVYHSHAESELSVVLPPSEAEKVTLQLFNQTGMKVMERVVTGKDLSKPALLNLNTLSKTVYLLWVNNEQNTWNRRIIVR